MLSSFCIPIYGRLWSSLTEPLIKYIMQMYKILLSIVPIVTHALFVLPISAQVPLQVQDSSDIHTKCLKAVDYAGCVGVKPFNEAEDELITGVLWRTAKWDGDKVTINVNRLRGGGLWFGESMRLSTMVVDCSTARFDVRSDGYAEQGLEGDARRQAPLIYGRLCTKPRPLTSEAEAK